MIEWRNVPQAEWVAYSVSVVDRLMFVSRISPHGSLNQLELHTKCFMT